MRKAWIFSATAFLALLELFSLLPPREEPPLPIRERNYLTGAIHVHSTFSDGGGGVPTIAQAAKDSGFDFVVLTDHNNTDARKNGFEKNYDGTDVFVEMEASVSTGHLLIFSSHTPARKFTDKEIFDDGWRHLIREPSAEGLFTVVSHPSNIKNSWRYHEMFPADGVELINLDSLWQRALKESTAGFILTTLIAPFNNYLAAMRFYHVYPPDFEWWDASNVLEHGHFGILAHDAHSRLKLNDRMVYEWPSYRTTFSLGQNIVFYNPPLADDFEKRKTQIYQSIKKGRSAILFQSMHEFRGNHWYIEKDGKRFQSGDSIPVGGTCRSVVALPKTFPYRAVARLYRDGKMINESPVGHDREASFAFPCERATFRTEIWANPRTALHLLMHREVPYLFYNPIYVDY